ncbi:MAG: adenylate kinase [archaeon]|nr:adenylate kinase [archaeon]
MKSRIVLLGPPGAGKGTQAEILEKELGFTKLSTGDMLREEIRNKTELGEKAKIYVESGNLVPDEIVIEMIKKRIRDISGAILFDGYPRTVKQADALAHITDIDLAINIDVKDEVLINRIAKRLMCPKCGAVYHLVNKPPRKDWVCDKCSTNLYQRDDDREETVVNRLKVYRQNTLPLINYYSERNKLVVIDGNKGTIHNIFERIRVALEN